MDSRLQAGSGTTALLSMDLTFHLDFCSNPTAASERGRDHNSGDLGKQAVKRSGRLLVVSLDLRHKTHRPVSKAALV